jgi:hypothetical protein
MGKMSKAMKSDFEAHKLRALQLGDLLMLRSEVEQALAEKRAEIERRLALLRGEVRARPSKTEPDGTLL